MPQLDLLIFYDVVWSVLIYFVFICFFNVYFILYVHIFYESFFYAKSKLLVTLTKVIDRFCYVSFFFNFFPINLTTGFVNPGSLEMASIISTHNDIYYYLQFIFFIVMWFLIFSLKSGTKYWFPDDSSKFLYPTNKLDLISESFDSCSILEIAWTVLPSFCLLLIGYPSISLLYSMDEQINSDFFIKIIGSQWYWSYEYPEVTYDDNRSFKYDSVMQDHDKVDVALPHLDNMRGLDITDYSANGCGGGDAPLPEKSIEEVISICQKIIDISSDIIHKNLKIKEDAGILISTNKEIRDEANTIITKKVREQFRFINYIINPSITLSNLNDIEVVKNISSNFIISPSSKEIINNNIAVRSYADYIISTYTRIINEADSTIKRYGQGKSKLFNILLGKDYSPSNTKIPSSLEVREALFNSTVEATDVLIEEKKTLKLFAQTLIDQNTIIKDKADDLINSEVKKEFRIVLNKLDDTYSESINNGTIINDNIKKNEYADFISLYKFWVSGDKEILEDTEAVISYNKGIIDCANSVISAYTRIIDDADLTISNYEQGKSKLFNILLGKGYSPSNTKIPSSLEVREALFNAIVSATDESIELRKTMKLLSLEIINKNTVIRDEASAKIIKILNSNFKDLTMPLHKLKQYSRLLNPEILSNINTIEKSNYMISIYSPIIDDADLAISNYEQGKSKLFNILLGKEDSPSNTKIPSSLEVRESLFNVVADATDALIEKKKTRKFVAQTLFDQMTIIKDKATAKTLKILKDGVTTNKDFYSDFNVPLPEVERYIKLLNMDIVENVIIREKANDVIAENTPIWEDSNRLIQLYHAKIDEMKSTTFKHKLLREPSDTQDSLINNSIKEAYAIVSTNKEIIKGANNEISKNIKIREEADNVIKQNVRKQFNILNALPSYEYTLPPINDSIIADEWKIEKGLTTRKLNSDIYLIARIRSYAEKIVSENNTIIKDANSSDINKLIIDYMAYINHKINSSYTKKGNHNCLIDVESKIMKYKLHDTDSVTSYGLKKGEENISKATNIIFENEKLISDIDDAIARHTKKQFDINSILYDNNSILANGNPAAKDFMVRKNNIKTLVNMLNSMYAKKKHWLMQADAKIAKNKEIMQKESMRIDGIIRDHISNIEQKAIDSHAMDTFRYNIEKFDAMKKSRGVAYSKCIERLNEEYEHERLNEEYEHERFCPARWTDYSDPNSAYNIRKKANQFNLFKRLDCTSEINKEIYEAYIKNIKPVRTREEYKSEFYKNIDTWIKRTVFENSEQWIEACDEVEKNQLIYKDTNAAINDLAAKYINCLNSLMYSFNLQANKELLSDLDIPNYIIDRFIHLSDREIAKNALIGLEADSLIHKNTLIKETSAAEISKINANFFPCPDRESRKLFFSLFRDYWTDSLMTKMDSYDDYDRKYLKVNAPLFIMYDVPITAVITSSDVLHSWAVPALGVKMDACPGRLNQVQFNSYFKTEENLFLTNTLYWGQCSEFCGVGHGFMPILVKSSHLYTFFDDILVEFLRRKVRPYERGMFGSYPSVIYSPDKKPSSKE